jgi:hypothetical protein
MELIPGDVPPPNFTKLFVLMAIFFLIVYPEQFNEVVSAKTLAICGIALFILFRIFTRPSPKAKQQ